MALNYPGTFAPAAGPGIDAFARLRVSEPVLLVDTKQVGGTPTLNITTSVSGSGAAAYQIDRSSTFLTVGPAIGTAVRQTKSRAIYQAGKSLLVFMTFDMAPAEVGLRQRVGYFDPKNGIFLQRSDAALSIVRRSFVTGVAVDTPVAQANWNVDTLDGNGPSGIVLDTTKTNILMLDFEWLGVGQVRCFMVIDGMPIWFHSFKNANNLDAVYMTNPNLPMRWEIEATGILAGTATLESICGSVNSEGGYETNGVTAGADMVATGKLLASGTATELLAIRLRSSFTEFATAFVQQLSVLASTNSNFLWRLVANPTETGAGAWSNVNASSVLERNTTRTVTDGTGFTLASGYVASDTSSINIVDRPVFTLGTTLGGVTDVYSLQVRNLGAGNETYLGSLTWREVY
jgi:hypothetical protein